MKNTANKFKTLDEAIKAGFPAQVIQTNKSGTCFRTPSVIDGKAGSLVEFKGFTFEVGEILLRDKGSVKRALIPTDKVGGLKLTPVNAGSNVFK